MKKRFFTLLLAVALSAGLLAACRPSSSGGTTATATNTPAPAATTDSGTAEQEPAPAASSGGVVQLNHPDAISGEEGDSLDLYEFSLYYSYDWWGIKTWGDDETSKFWSSLWNIKIDQQKPDADADAKLNLMMSSGDLPDVILMDRGAQNLRACQLGTFIDLAPLQAKNPSYDSTVPKSIQNLLQIDGVLYAVPHWARSLPTGGNDCWIYDKLIYEKVGSPDLSTFEGLYNYAKLVKENVSATDWGLSVIPFSTENNGSNAHDKILFGFYRCFGGPNRGDLWTARIDGRLQSIYRDPVFKAAAMEANRWYREGLIVETQFSENQDQLLERFTDGRVGLLMYDMSQDSYNHFRQILMQNHPEDTWEVLRDPVYPPANGLSPSKIYADEKGGMGWNVHGITTKAKNPQRIFDFLTYMLSRQGSIEMMYGPKGDWWNELNANGAPILHTPESELAAEEKDRIGSWFWSFCNFSDWVDLIKFEVNNMEPPEKRDWVISMQSDVLTPIMFVTDEYANLALEIDPLDDLGINRRLIDEEIRAVNPRIIMAASQDEASRLFDELLAFMDEYGLKEIEAAYDAKYQENVKAQGFTSYNR